QDRSRSDPPPTHPDRNGRRLPACRERGMMPSDQDHGQLAGVRILVAEDSLPITVVVETAIEAEGGTLIGPAASLDDACALARAESPDLAVIDLNLEQRSALGLVCDLAAAGVKVVVATGYDLDAETRRRLAGIPVLIKPYTAAQLIERIAAALSSGKPAA